MIQGAFEPEDRGRAIGSWSGPRRHRRGDRAVRRRLRWCEYASWRWIFLINLPLAVVTVVVAQRCVPGDPRPGRAGALRLRRAPRWPRSRWAGDVRADRVGHSTLRAAGAAVVGSSPASAFLLVEHRSDHPMLPLGLFADRTFSAANAMTLLVYAALGAVLFFLVLQLQTVSGYGALEAGRRQLPITLCMLFLASRGGALGTRIGPRIPMTVGPLVMAVGVALLLRLGADVDVLDATCCRGLTVFGLGLALMVAR